MKKPNYKLIEKYIATNVVVPFYNKRIEKLKKVKMRDIIKRKNPYLFKAKNIQTAGDLVKDILDAYLSSQEETIFGDLLEGLAIHINSQIFKGEKAEEIKFKSVDLIFHRERKTYVVGIKSGPNWGNSDQINTMRKNLKKAKEILRSEGVEGDIIGVNGCIYGKDNNPHKKYKRDFELDYYKLCGQEFWELISGDSELYKKLIKPLDREVQKKDDDFKEIYVKKINEMTKDLIDLFYIDDSLNWDKIVEYVSKKN
ncbi:TdeIII family type II restriction endonuclease [Patescibacteria group bacterium]|nr:TdeIII family type II restriction endonuclease [Patescibacteria group bacterium]